MHNSAVTHSRTRAAKLIRCLAAGVDLILLGILARIVEWLVDLAFARLGTRPPVRFDELVLVIAIVLISTCEVFGQASPGKLLCGLRIRGPDGQAAPIHRRIVRWSIKLTPIWLALIANVVQQFMIVRGATRREPFVGWIHAAATIAGAGLFVAFVPTFSRARQALYDMIARTAVYRGEPEHLEQDRGFEPLLAPSRAASPEPASMSERQFSHGAGGMSRGRDG